ncbi:restriction endonuclease subunit S [Enterococcus faecalis]|uniref:restriction endonuclease subunit S n=1 Tax=Enterococcus faecalis TaxID=1351 RepID=UPI000DF8715B|nr:restriction endonuclease subunit S [Enterococcus faecalis]STQ15977.1 type I site-specific deoxyribonuclease specificity subunit [Enterococcus faecalis]
MAKIDDSVKKKVPELRFKGFTDDWEERKLGDTETHFTDGNYGESYPSAKDMSDKANGIPFLRGSDFSNGYLDSSNANYIKPEKHAELTSGHIKQDDIVIAVRGSLGTLGYATKENEGWNINSQLAILRTNKSEISGMFLIQYLLGSKGQKEIFSRNTGTALKQLPIKQLKDIPVPVPTLLEQQKIGSFFKQLDNTIALHQRKLDLLKEQKKGYLQKMFPKNGAKVPELRFAGFADDWEERKLGDTETHFTDGNYGESYPSAKDMSDKANGIPFLRGSDFSNGYLDSSNANYIKPEKHAELTSGHIKQDDIVIAVRGSLGTLGYATKENEGWNINSQLAILRTNKSEISGMFLIQYLLGSKGQKEIFSRNTGTALKQLPIKQLKDIPVPVPTLLEQQKIGSFFKQLDNTIALHQRKLDLLKEQKKGFLQKMFV